MKTILVTGCAGFLGSKVCQLLLADPENKVIGVDLLYWGEQSKRVVDTFSLHKSFYFTKLDVRDIYRLTQFAAKADVIIHLAAIVGAALCDEKPFDALSINFAMISPFVKKLSREQKLIFFMTNSGYGTSGEAECTEEDELRPVSLYGRTKVEAERAVLSHENAISLRLATVYGNSLRLRLDLLLNNFVERILDDGEITLFEPEFRRNFVGINDVAAATKFAIDKNLTGIYNFGNPALNMTKLAIAKEVFKTLCMQEKILIGGGKDPDRRDYVVSNKKILAEGFTFKHSLREGIEAVAARCAELPKAIREEMRNYK